MYQSACSRSEITQSSVLLYCKTPEKLKNQSNLACPNQDYGDNIKLTSADSSALLQDEIENHLALYHYHQAALTALAAPSQNNHHKTTITVNGNWALTY